VIGPQSEVYQVKVRRSGCEPTLDTSAAKQHHPLPAISEGARLPLKNGSAFRNFKFTLLAFTISISGSVCLLCGPGFSFRSAVETKQTLGIGASQADVCSILRSEPFVSC
jgi:hypothetical protein